MRDVSSTRKWQTCTNVVLGRVVYLWFLSTVLGIEYVLAVYLKNSFVFLEMVLPAEYSVIQE